MQKTKSKSKATYNRRNDEFSSRPRKTNRQRIKPNSKHRKAASKSNSQRRAFAISDVNEQLKTFGYSELFFISPPHSDQIIFRDENDILNCIEDIYPVIKDEISIFVNTGQPSDDTHASKVLGKMLSLYDEIGHNWKLEAVQEYSIINYYIVKAFEYELGGNSRSFPVKPIFDKRKEYPKFFEAFMIMCALLDSRGVSMWNDQFHDMACQQLEDEIAYGEMDQEDMPFRKAELKEYNHALATLQAVIKKKPSIELFKKKLEKVETGELKDYLKLSLPIIESNEFIRWFENAEFYMDSQDYPPTSLLSACSFLWSWNEDSYIFNQVEGCFRDNADNYGISPFCQIDALNKDNLIEKPKSDLPYIFVEFMESMCNMIKIFEDEQRDSRTIEIEAGA